MVAVFGEPNRFYTLGQILEQQASERGLVTNLLRKLPSML